MCCQFLLQGIFSTQGSNPSLLHCRWILHHLSHWREPGASLTLVELIVISSTLHLKQYNPQTSLYPQTVKNLPADAGGPGYIPRDDPLDKGVATHSSILNWRIPWTERSLVDCSRKESDMTEHMLQALHYLSDLISWCSKNTLSCFSTSVFVDPAFFTSVSRKPTWTLKFKCYLTQKSSNVFFFSFLLTLHRTSHLCVDIYILLWNTDSSSCLTPVRLLGHLERQLYLIFDHLEGPTSSFAQVRHWRGLSCVVKKTSSPSSGRTKKLHATFAFFKLFYQKRLIHGYYSLLLYSLLRNARYYFLGRHGALS